MTSTKKCNACGETKPLETFTRRKSSPDGYRTICKPCRLIRTTKHRKLCRNCPTEFITYNKKQASCSPECSRKHLRAGATDDVGRTCSKCFVYKPWGEFHLKASGKNRHAPYCKDCSRLKRDKKRYNLTDEDKAAVLVCQQGRCAGCRSRFTDDFPYTVDHCHVNGPVRGFLCDACNVTLGTFKTELLLQAAAGYLEYHNARLGVTPPPLPD